EKATPPEKVRVAGEVVSPRRLTTNNGDAMAVMVVEDWHETANSIEVVMFPRTCDNVRIGVKEYKRQRYRDQNEGAEPPQDFIAELEEGEILVVVGKFDSSRGDAQIICDKIEFEFEYMSADDFAQVDYTSSAPAWYDEKIVSDSSSEPPPAFLDYDEETGEVVEEEPQPEPVIVADVMPATQGASAPTPAVEPRFGAGDAQPAWAASTETAVLAEDDLLFDDLTEGDDTRESVQIVVYLERSREPDKDRRRLRRIHRTFTGYPGKDRFSIIIRSGRSHSTMDFPNHTTGWCDALQHDLAAIVGRENIEVESIGTREHQKQDVI
ncbi:MAG: hypothetical protein KC496_09975, partial [Anaerolineae bacterium]|nr:hypothetical protein [Anaerolineae bacterium]